MPLRRRQLPPARPLLLLLLAAAVAPARGWRSSAPRPVASPVLAGVSRSRAAGRTFLAKDAIPPEIVAAEERSAGQGRQVRVAAFTGAALLSAALGAVGSSSTPLADAVPLHGSILGNLLYSAVAGLGGTLVFLEFQTKTQNQRRIYEEAQRRASAPAKKGGKGGAKAKGKGKKGARVTKATKGFSGSSAASAKPAAAAPPAAAAAPTPAEPVAEEAPATYESPTKGLGEAMEKLGLGDAFREADAAAAASARQLNAELEARKILPKAGGGGQAAAEDGEAPAPEQEKAE